MEVTFFAVFKSFEYKIAISANFVQTVKNSNIITPPRAEKHGKNLSHEFVSLSVSEPKPWYDNQTCD